MLSKRQNISSVDNGRVKRQKQSGDNNHAQVLYSSKTSDAMLGVAYRDDQNGRGAFTDHYTIRRMTGNLTSILAPESVDLTHFQQQQACYTAHGKSYPLSLPLDASLPVVVDLSMLDQIDGLIIPGLARSTEKETLFAEDDRATHENRLIQEARKRGIPILGLCAGSWRLWQFYGGELKAVQEHCYGGGMFYLKKDGEVGVNKQIHRIAIKPYSLLFRAMQLPAPSVKPAVNSIHWLAPNEITLPSELIVSATTVSDKKIAPNSRQGSAMKVEKKTIEAFETKHGAPVFGLQWHAEAYCDQNAKETNAPYHQNVFHFFSKAATAYRMKKNLLQEMKTSPPTLRVTGR